MTRTRRSPLALAALLAWGLSVAGCEPSSAPRCVPGATTTCRCAETPGYSTCDGEGLWARCDCRRTCREDVIAACRCEDGRIGIERCLVDGEPVECVCPERCVEGESGACPCSDGLEGVVRCTDGALSACDCTDARCTTSAACRCADGSVSVRPCVDGRLGACLCGDAAMSGSP